MRIVLLTAVLTVFGLVLHAINPQHPFLMWAIWSIGSVLIGLPLLAVAASRHKQLLDFGATPQELGEEDEQPVQFTELVSLHETMLRVLGFSVRGSFLLANLMPGSRMFMRAYVLDKQPVVAVLTCSQYLIGKPESGRYQTKTWIEMCSHHAGKLQLHTTNNESLPIGPAWPNDVFAIVESSDVRTLLAVHEQLVQMRKEAITKGTPLHLESIRESVAVFRDRHVHAGWVEPVDENRYRLTRGGFVRLLAARIWPLKQISTREARRLGRELYSLSNAATRSA